jgi:hypothetical protein
MLLMPKIGNIPRTAPLVYILEEIPTAAPEEANVGISWSDYQAAILDSISGAKYVLAGVDVDQDGKQEFIVPIDYGILNGVPTRQIALFEAVGDNDYVLAWSYTYPGEAAGELVQPAVGDLDGDGNLEILGIHVQPEDVDPALPNFYVFECKGDNDYGTEPTVAWDMNDNRRNNIRCAAAYDLDNDGTMEVILTDHKGPVVASVTNFDVPMWTIEYQDTLSYERPDMAGITLCNLDGDAYMEVGLTPLQEKPQIDLYLIEYDGSAYQMIKPAPKHFYGKGVIHALDAADLDGDGRDEMYIGAVETSLLYVVTKPTGDVTELDTTDIYFIGHVEHPDYEAGTGWMPGGTLGDPDGDGNMSFLGSASGTVGCGVHDWEYQGGDVTDAQNWIYSYINVNMSWGNDFFIYGIDFADDMDGDGQPEFVVARGYPNIPRTAPLVYVLEGQPASELEEAHVGISWSDAQTAILDSISGAKYVLAGVDVDQDGKQEFIVPIDYGILNGIPTRQIALFEAVGDNDYELAWAYTYPGEAAGELTQPAVGDLDGDGNLEILAIHVQPEAVDPALPNFYVFECKGDNDYGTEPTVTWDMNDNRRNNIRCAAAYDLDNDGKMEVILTDNKAPVIASVTNFDVPLWTIEYIDSLSYERPDMAGITLCNMDGDAYMEVGFTPLQEKPQLDLYLIEYDGSAYQMIKPAPKHFYGKGVIHSLEAADLDGDGRDEMYIGAVETALLYVVTKPTGDITELDTTDIYYIGHVEHPDYEPGTGWLPGATLGDADGDGKMSFLGSASGTVGCGIHDWEYQGGDVTNTQNWKYSYINVDLGWGNDFFIYGIDFADDMDGDGKCEFVVARGYPNIPRDMPLVYVMEDGFATGVESEDPLSVGIPETFSLKQNYPNPFNPTTTIQFSLPKNEYVSLVIYNIMGRRIRTLVDEDKEADNYTVIWDGCDSYGTRVATGIYFYQLLANDAVITKKMLLLK